VHCQHLRSSMSLLPNTTHRQNGTPSKNDPGVTGQSTFRCRTQLVIYRMLQKAKRSTRLGFATSRPLSSTHRSRIRPNSTLSTSALDLSIGNLIYMYHCMPRPTLSIAIRLHECALQSAAVRTVDACKCHLCDRARRKRWARHAVPRRWGHSGQSPEWSHIAGDVAGP
jgi:hypothetical protein